MVSNVSEGFLQNITRQTSDRDCERCNWLKPAETYKKPRAAACADALDFTCSGFDPHEYHRADCSRLLALPNFCF